MNFIGFLVTIFSDVFDKPALKAPEKSKITRSPKVLFKIIKLGSILKGKEAKNATLQ